MRYTIRDLRQCVERYASSSHAFTELLYNVTKQYTVEHQCTCLPLLIPVPIIVQESRPNGKIYYMNVSSAKTSLDYYFLRDDISGLEFKSEQGADSQLSVHNSSAHLNNNGIWIPARILDLDIANVILMAEKTINAESGELRSLVVLGEKRLHISRAKCITVFDEITTNKNNTKFDLNNHAFPDYPDNYVRFNTSRGLIQYTIGALYFDNERIYLLDPDLKDMIILSKNGNSVKGYYRFYSIESSPFECEIDVVIETLADLRNVFSKIKPPQYTHSISR